MSKLFITLLYLLLFHTIISYIVIPFKGNNLSIIYNNSNDKDFLEDYIMSTFYNQLYTTIGIGYPEQYVVINIITKQVDFLFNKMNCLLFYNNNYIDKSNLSLNNRTIPINITKIGYNKNISKGFSKNNNISLPISFINNNYFSGKERLKIDDYRNILNLTSNNKTQIFPHSQDHLVNFSFVYEEVFTNNDSTNGEICGSIGLDLYYSKNNNKFIEQLKSSNITKNYYWSFNYTSLDKGLIIFGILPHEYYPDKYKIYNLEETYTSMEEGVMKWALDLNEIYFYNKKKKIFVPSAIAEGEFEFTMQLIVGSYSYKELILKYFFQEYMNNKICIEEEYKLDIDYSLIRCKKEKFQKNIKNFPQLFFYNRGLQNIFELSYEDLFIEIGDYFYFLIIFRKGGLYQSNQTWKLGIPFLKRHQIILNSDTKRIGYYVKNKIDIDINNNKNKGSEEKNSKGFFNKIKNLISLRTFIEIIIVIIFIIILIYLGKKLYNYKAKQKKPFELQDEDYDYFSNSNNSPDKENKKKNNFDKNNNGEDSINNWENN